MLKKNNSKTQQRITKIRNSIYENLNEKEEEKLYELKKEIIISKNEYFKFNAIEDNTKLKIDLFNDLIKKDRLKIKQNFRNIKNLSNKINTNFILLKKIIDDKKNSIDNKNLNQVYNSNYRMNCFDYILCKCRKKQNVEKPNQLKKISLLEKSNLGKLNLELAFLKEHLSINEIETVKAAKGNILYGQSNILYYINESKKLRENIKEKKKYVNELKQKQNNIVNVNTNNTSSNYTISITQFEEI